MINKYWDPKYFDLIFRVREWNALEKGSYDNVQLRRYEDFMFHDLTEAQIESQINKALEDFKKYFYCPVCGRKSLIKDAVIKKETSVSLKLKNAFMPGWWKIQTTSSSMYYRLCPECSKRKGKISYDKVYAGNAIPTEIEIIKANKKSGGLLLWVIFLIIVSAICIFLYTYDLHL